MKKTQKNNLRILPQSEVHHLINGLLINRGAIKEMVVMTVDNDGSVIFHTSIDDMLRINGLLDLLMQELRNSMLSNYAEDGEEEEPKGPEGEK
jgi:uncharacterized alpha/beta hydrolase family protein